MVVVVHVDVSRWVKSILDPAFNEFGYNENSVITAVADPGFPRLGAVNPKGEEQTYYFGHFVHKTV